MFLFDVFIFVVIVRLLIRVNERSYLGELLRVVKLGVEALVKTPTESIGKYSVTLLTVVNDPFLKRTNTTIVHTSRVTSSIESAQK